MITAGYVRGFIIVVTLFLAAAANLIHFSCDADHDETTPPVVVELNFVVSAPSGTASHATIAPVRLSPAQDQRQPVSFDPLRSIRELSTIEQSSAQVALPLLC